MRARTWFRIGLALRVVALVGICVAAIEVYVNGRELDSGWLRPGWVAIGVVIVVAHLARDRGRVVEGREVAASDDTVRT